MANPCEEFIEYHDDNDRYLLKAGDILYSGNTMDKSPLTLESIFSYVGQRGMDTDISSVSNYVLYASSNYETGWGYASSCSSNGYVHKFVVTNDVLLLRGDTFEDAELIDKCVCTPYDIYYGFMVFYGTKNNKQWDEFALCNSHQYLDYVESIKCVPIGQHTEWFDATQPTQTGGKPKRKQYKKNCSANMTNLSYIEVRELAKSKGIKITDKGKYKKKGTLILELKKYK